jgi:hypothetical protein
VCAAARAATAGYPRYRLGHGLHRCVAASVWFLVAVNRQQLYGRCRSVGVGTPCVVAAFVGATCSVGRLIVVTVGIGKGYMFLLSVLNH